LNTWKSETKIQAERRAHSVASDIARKLKRGIELAADAFQIEGELQSLQEQVRHNLDGESVRATKDMVQRAHSAQPAHWSGNDAEAVAVALQLLEYLEYALFELRCYPSTEYA
jgi:hypothetical protein